MRTPKALLLFDGRPLIVHVVEALQRVSADVVVVAAPAQDLPSMPVTLVRDDVAYQGPVGGLCYGLRAASSDVCFVTACDSAFLNANLISHLLSRIPGVDVVVPRWQERLQPLHAIYRRSVLPVLEAQLARGELRPVSLFDKVRTLEIEEGEIRRFDPDGSSFFNMNAPEDYEEALRRWRWRASIRCTVELFGVARLIAQTNEIVLTLPAGASLSDLFSVLAERQPAFVGRVIGVDGGLAEGYACNVNGLRFVGAPSYATTPVHQGDNILIVAADAGG